MQNNKIFIILLFCTMFVFGSLTNSQPVSHKPLEYNPWWQSRKIIIMWGQWPHSVSDTKPEWWGDNGTRADKLPETLFKNISLAGATVFAETCGYNPDNAKKAHKYGMKYFATVFNHFLPKLSGGRTWVKDSGQEHWFKCPLDEFSYENWLVKPYLNGIKQGLIDGIHTDWEYYGGLGEATGMCYCDDCFSNYMSFKEIYSELPKKNERLNLLKSKDLLKSYKGYYDKRRIAMFSRLRKKLQSANSNLLFSSYGTVFTDFNRAMNTPDTPFIFLDSRHYINDGRQPWWDSYSVRFKQEGFIYIPGGWTNALFGAQASRVSAARWIYESAINEDGCWLWFERELDDEILRSHATANAQIKSVEKAVGRFIFDGKVDYNFVTAVEWAGRPELLEAVKNKAYHLRNEHLLHINNVNTEWPLRVRLKLSRLQKNEKWTVKDALTGLYYTPEQQNAEWTSKQLQEGLVVSMEPRSDIFLQISPITKSAKIDKLSMICSQEFNTLPDHKTASEKAAPIKLTNPLYIMKNSVYGKEMKKNLAFAEKIIDLPKDGWVFKMDPNDVGVAQKWYLPSFSRKSWGSIEIGDFWGDKGGLGAGWYSNDINIPEIPAGKRIYLQFGAVDEHLIVWVNGKYTGDYDRIPDIGWDQPFIIDITDNINSGKNHLAFRVYNRTGAGGIWKPVSIFAGQNNKDDIVEIDHDSDKGWIS